ncbi:uncharacterized protein LOC143522699 isoform X2 [Brachyhypopomus gauderio]|uniref:uncharacterized protein LOC143522699 isoform X2 n=1 Tax=Brachyhypopomus gauderio TaxID=698409 RepID=UPI004042ED74
MFNLNCASVMMSFHTCVFNYCTATVKIIQGHVGGSVLLSCSRTGLHTNTPTWTFRDNEIYPTDQTQRYTGRVQLVTDSAGNPSIRISHLTEDDKGVYRCIIGRKTRTVVLFIKGSAPVTNVQTRPEPSTTASYQKPTGPHSTETPVKGYTAVKRRSQLHIRSHVGDSALLPCYCTNTHTRPERFTWYKVQDSSYTEISSQSEEYRNRVQLGTAHSPDNHSLLISHLTEEDGGLYRCYIEGSEYTDVKLTVEGSAPVTKVETSPVSSTTASYQRPTGPHSTETPVKGCTVVKRQFHIRSHVGESVLLPCYCTNTHTRPERFTWMKYNTKRNTLDVISSESEQYRNRVQLGTAHSPGNHSLLISHLTEEDGGLYRCYIEGDEYTDMILTVEVTKVQSRPEPSTTASYQRPTGPHSTETPVKYSPQTPPYIPVAMVTVIFLHIIFAVVYCTKRNKVSERSRVHYNTAEGDGTVSLQ